MHSIMRGFPETPAALLGIANSCQKEVLIVLFPKSTVKPYWLKLSKENKPVS